jgi:hypothetical protein
VVLLFLMATSGFGADSVTLSGRVLDYENVPVGGLQLSLILMSGDGGSTPPIPTVDGVQPIYASTADDGSFSFQAAAGIYELGTIGSEEFARARSTVALAAGGSVSNYVLRVHRNDVEIFGKVLGPAGEVVSDCQVRFSPGSSISYGFGEVDAFTDAQGNYRLRVFPGSWTGAPVGVQPNRHGYIVSAQTNVTLAAAGTNEVNFTLVRPTITLSGIVKDQKGDPIANLPLFASRDHDDPFYNGFDTLSGEDGRFSFKVNTGAWRVGYGKFSDSADRGYESISYPIEIAASDVATNIVLPKITSRLNGFVKTPAGDPMTNIQVMVSTTFNGVDLFNWFTTGTNGGFSAPLINGAWKVSLTSYQLSQLGYLAPPEVMVTLADSTNSVVLTALTPPCRIRGVIRDEAGAPVSNLPMQFYSTNTSTWFWTTADAQGRYLVGVTPGEWIISVDLGAQMAAHIFVDAIAPINVADGTEAQRDITVVRASHRVRVTLRDEDGILFTPEQPARLDASLAKRDFGRSVYGNFFGGVAELYVTSGDWWFYISPTSGYWPLSSRILSVTNDVEMSLTVRKVIYNAALAGQVVDEEGKPVTNVLVYTYAGALSSVETRTDLEGKFSFNMPATTGSIWVDAPGYLFANSSFELAAGTNTFRVIHARKIGSTLTVRLNSTAANTNEFFAVNARTRIGNDVFSGYGNSDNPTVTLSLFPGEWMISTTGYFELDRGLDNRPLSIHRLIDRRLITISGVEQTLIIEAASAVTDATIRGRVVDDLGAPVEIWDASAETIRGDFIQGEIKSDGSFEVHAFPGDWSISAWTRSGPAGYSASVQGVKVAAGETRDLGAIVLPRRGPTALIQLRTLAGRIPSFEEGFAVYAKRTVNGIRYSAYNSSQTGQIPLQLTPGEWELSFSVPSRTTPGFANIQPITINVPPGGSTNTIVLASAPVTVSAPRFSVASEPGGKPHLRLHMDKSRPVDIESSTDLKTWKFHMDEFPYVGFVDVPSEAATNQVQFFRAVVLDY